MINVAAKDCKLIWEADSEQSAKVAEKLHKFQDDKVETRMK